MNEYKRDLRQKSIYNMTIFSRAYSKGNELIKLDQMDQSGLRDRIEPNQTGLNRLKWTEWAKVN